MQVDDLIKTMKEATEAIQKAQGDSEARTKALVESTIKEALRNHPGVTQERRVEFDSEMPTTEQEILSKMPAEAQMKMDQVYILSKLLNKKPTELKSWGTFIKSAGDFKKALDTSTSGGVSEWMPTGFSPNLQALIRLQLKVAALFPTIQMPSNPFVMPVAVGRFKSYKHAENTADTGQTKITKGDASSISNKVTLTAIGHATEVLCSDEADEDAMIAMMPYIQSEIVTALAEGREDAILNGDTAGSHEDTDVSSSDDRRKLFLGLRALCHDNTYTRDLATLSFENLTALRGDMGKYGVVPANLAYITGVKGYMKLLTVDGVTTLDKYGASATILSGELAKIGGIPVVVSEWVREDLDSTGLYGSGEVKTAIYLAHRNGFAVGERRGGDVKVLRELYAESGQIAMLARERIDFEPIYPIASTKTVYLGTNVG